MGSAALENKLDNEFLRVRGIRVTEPEFMYSAFTYGNDQPIGIFFENDQNDHVGIGITEWGKPWHWEAVIHSDELKITTLDETQKRKGRNYSTDETEKIEHRNKSFRELNQKFNAFPYLIYAPENTKLRQFQEEGQILPLGIGGEGLFKHFVTLLRDHPELFEKIKAQLAIIDWFEDINVPQDLMFTERRLNIKDRFIHPDLHFFDQRSANEGFLFLLFYFTLFISPHTPDFFAIDNIDNSLNPKLCGKLVQTLSELSKEHHKQAIITTHNPSVLDGLNLDDENQRLFVIYRNADGHTVAKRIYKKQSINGTESVRLSEAFIRGYLGGLPKNF